jgi:hypothetical protein
MMVSFHIAHRTQICRRIEFALDDSQVLSIAWSDQDFYMAQRIEDGCELNQYGTLHYEVCECQFCAPLAILK